MKTILNVMKKWGVVFAVVAFAISAFLVIQNAQAYYGDYFDDASYYAEDYGYYGDYGYDDYEYYEDDYYGGGYYGDYGYDDYEYYEDDYYAYDDYGYDDYGYYGDYGYDDYGYYDTGYDDCLWGCYDDYYYEDDYGYDDCEYYGDCYDECYDCYDDCEYYGDCYDECYDCYDDCEYYGDCYDECYWGCTPPPAPIDVCPNIPGNQSQVPAGMKIDQQGKCVEKNDPLEVVCIATPSHAEVGQTVQFTANATGGNGNYVYSWSGTNGLSGSSRTVSKQYTTAGSKTATVKVTVGNKAEQANCYVEIEQVVDVCPNIAGNQTQVPSGKIIDDNGNCVNPPVDVCPNIAGNQSTVPSGKVLDDNGNCVTPTPDLNVYCVATNSSNNLKVGDSVTWTATATGGNGNYSYSWSGSENLSGSNRVISKVYNSAGTKTATVTVTSGGKTDTADCTTYVQEREEDLNVVCEVNRTHVEKGQEVRYTASATGGNGSYTYTWSGSSPLSGRTGATQYVTYTSTGSKTASVTVRSGNQTDVANCNTVVVEEEDHQDLDLICEVSRTHVEKGQEVRYTAQATGGTGNYSYSWTGSSPLNGRTGATQYITYTTTGSKSASVRVTSGNMTETVNCNTVVVEEEEDEDLDLICEVNKTRVEEGETVRYKATATGGNGNYSYEWDGSSPLDGKTGRTIDVKYTSEGRKHASVTVRSGSEEETVECDTVVVEEEEEEEDDFNVTCAAYPGTVFVNQNVTWSANVSGASGTKHYDWSGTNGLSGDESVVTKSYNTPGTKTATVEVTINGRTESDDCTVNVQGSTGQVSVYENPGQGTLASLSSIYLSQVPYTGPEDYYLAYIALLITLSIAGTYYVVVRKAKLSRKNVIDAFKQANLARKGIN